MSSTSASGSDHFTILVGLDFEEGGGLAFDQAAKVARRIPGSALHLVHVFPEGISERRMHEVMGGLRTYVSDKIAALGDARPTKVGVHLRAGDPIEGIESVARELGADLIVVGAHRRASIRSRLLGGALSERLGACATCPVLVARVRKDEELAPEAHIEPPCPECVRARVASNGERFWCDIHSRHRVHGHTFSHRREHPLAMHDSEVIPTGVRF